MIHSLAKLFGIQTCKSSQKEKPPFADKQNQYEQLIAFAPDPIVIIGTAGQIKAINKAAEKISGYQAAELLGRVTKWSIWIFGIIIALDQLNVAPQVLNTLLMAVLGGIGLAIGIAFGLGGKEVAARILDKTAHTVMDKE